MTATADSSAPPTYRCANHADVETLVRCGKCDKPICPKCMVMTPVGVRCKPCANAKPLVIYDVGGWMMARAIGAGLISALLLASLIAFTPLFAFSFFASAFYGWLVATAIGKATNEKRGIRLQVIAIACCAFGLLATQGWYLIVLLWAPRQVIDVGTVVGATLGYNFLFQVGLSAVFAWSRLR